MTHSPLPEGRSEVRAGEPEAKTWMLLPCCCSQCAAGRIRATCAEYSPQRDPGEAASPQDPRRGQTIPSCPVQSVVPACSVRCECKGPAVPAAPPNGSDSRTRRSQRSQPVRDRHHCSILASGCGPETNPGLAG